MKNRLALFTALLSLATTAAHAQSSVTLYGLIDEGLTFTNNSGGHQAYQMSSGYAAGSRWGLKGSEDLGSGVKAVFQLENSFDLNNGSLNGGLEFGRQAYVGVSSDRIGTVTLGRQYDSVVDYLAPLTANGGWAGYLFAHPFDNDNTDNSFRLNNTVKYASNNIGGLRFGGVYSFSNSTGFASNRAYSLGANYTYGGLSVAGAYMDINDPGLTSNGAIATNDADFTASNEKVYGVGVSYALGQVKAGFVYTHTRLNQPQSTEYLSSIQPTTGNLSALSFDNYEVNAKYQATPALSASAMYVYTRGRAATATGDKHPAWNSIGLMSDYAISKRTSFYVQSMYQQVVGDKIGSALDDAAITGASGSSSSNRQLALRVAVMHTF